MSRNSEYLSLSWFLSIISQNVFCEGLLLELWFYRWFSLEERKYSYLSFSLQSFSLSSTLTLWDCEKKRSIEQLVMRYVEQATNISRRLGILRSPTISQQEGIYSKSCLYFIPPYQTIIFTFQQPRISCTHSLEYFSL